MTPTKVQERNILMINARAKIYRKTIVLFVVLIFLVFTLFQVYKAFYSGGAQAADVMGHVHASDDLSLEEVNIPGAPGGYNDVQLLKANGHGAYMDADRFFEDKMSKGGESPVAPNGIFTEQGVLLLSAAGLSIGQGNSLNAVHPSVYAGAGAGVDAGADADPGNGDEIVSLPITMQFAAGTALYPNSPLSAINIAVALDAPFNSINLASYTSPIAGAMLYAYQILEDNGEIVDSLAEYADRHRKPVYLTIDDGPSPMTRQFLDILKARGIRATFFVVGANVRRYPDIIREMYGDGHCIANHSNTHNYDNIYKSSASLRSEIEKCDKAISDALGFSYNTGIFRFPGGSTYRTASKYRNDVGKMGYTYYDWNCLNGDAQIRDKSADSLYDYMLATFKGQDEVILLMHDSESKQSTVNMLERAIDFFLEKDYEFRTLDEK